MEEWNETDVEGSMSEAQEPEKPDGQAEYYKACGADAASVAAGAATSMGLGGMGLYLGLRNRLTSRP